MLAEVVRLHISNHDGLTVGEIVEDLFIDYFTCAAIVQHLRRKGLCESTLKKPRKYKCEKHDALSQTVDDYVHRVIAREGMTTVEDIQSITWLSKYRISLSLKRLKNLGKISTTTGQGIRNEKQPVYIKRRPWKTTEIAYLKENLGKVHTSEICKVLNRTSRAVQMKASELGLSTVSRLCKKGHKMFLRNTGKWVCNECNCERERVKRSVARSTQVRN